MCLSDLQVPLCPMFSHALGSESNFKGIFPNISKEIPELEFFFFFFPDFHFLVCTMRARARLSLERVSEKPRGVVWNIHKIPNWGQKSVFRKSRKPGKNQTRAISWCCNVFNGSKTHNHNLKQHREKKEWAQHWFIRAENLLLSSVQFLLSIFRFQTFPLVSSPMKRSRLDHLGFLWGSFKESWVRNSSLGQARSGFHRT